MKLNPKHIYLLALIQKTGQAKLEITAEELGCTNETVAKYIKDLAAGGLIYINPHKKIDRFTVLPAGHAALSTANIEVALQQAKQRTYHFRTQPPKTTEASTGELHADVAFFADLWPTRQTPASDLVALAYGRIALTDYYQPVTEAAYLECKKMWKALPPHRKTADAKRAWAMICDKFEK